MLWIENAGAAYPLGSVVDVGVPRSHLSRVVLMLLGVPTLALIVTGLVHRALDPLATQTALALTGFAVFGVLLLVLAHIAARASATLAPRILTAPVEPVAVRLLNNRRVARS
jgi:type IV secretory pathway TrbD component